MAQSETDGRRASNEHVGGRGGRRVLIGSQASASRTVTVDPDMSVIDVGRLLTEGAIRHVAIVKGDEVVAVLSVRDICEVLLSDDAGPASARRDRAGRSINSPDSS